MDKFPAVREPLGKYGQNAPFCRVARLAQSGNKFENTIIKGVFSQTSFARSSDKPMGSVSIDTINRV